MQSKINLKTPDDKTIYGILDNVDDNSKLIIFVHGFTGNNEEYHYMNAVEFFMNRGISTFRFNLYGRETDARKSTDVSLQDHIDDTNRVIENFKDKFNEIYLVGHSLGALVATLADHSNVIKLMLWDPSSSLKNPAEKKMKLINELDMYLCDFRLQSLFSKKLIEEWMAIDVREMLDSMNIPVKVIFAGNENKYDHWKQYLVDKPVNGNYEIIEGASHTFPEPGAIQLLYEATYKWIKD